MQRPHVIGALCAFILSAGACAPTTHRSAYGPAYSSTAPSPQPAAGDALAAPRDVLLAPEIASARVADAYEAIEHLRPEYLRRDRGPTSILPGSQSGLTVYQDNVQLGDVRSLRDIPAGAIRSIRFLDAAAATIRWGLNHTGGVILVQTIGGGR